MAHLTLLKLIVYSEIKVHHKKSWGCWVLRTGEGRREWKKYSSTIGSSDHKY